MFYKVPANAADDESSEPMFKLPSQQASPQVVRKEATNSSQQKKLRRKKREEKYLETQHLQNVKLLKDIRPYYYKTAKFTSEFVDGTGDWLTLSRRATNGDVGTEFDGVINFEVGEDDGFFKSD